MKRALDTFFLLLDDPEREVFVEMGDVAEDADAVVAASPEHWEDITSRTY